MSKLINVRTLKEKSFHTIDLGEPYSDYLGNPEKNFKMMVYGPSGSGKSTFVIKLANHLAKDHGRVLYNSHEEGFSQTLKDRVMANNIDAAGLYFADRMSYEEMCEKMKKSRIQYAVIDSLQYMHFTYAQYQHFVKHMKGKALIIISQLNNRGSIKGGTDILHAVDIKINVHDGKAVIQSRFSRRGITTWQLYNTKSTTPTLFSNTL